jgi:Protein of unknown function (DUF4244)
VSRALPAVSARPVFRPPSDEGQASAEYALVLLGAASIAILLVHWVGTGKITDLLDAVFRHVRGQVPG